MSKGSSAREKVVQQLSQAQELISSAMALLDDDLPTTLKKSKGSAAKQPSSDLDFTVPLRPFVKRHAAGMSGAAKFTLLVAHLSQGDEGKVVALSDVEVHWNKMTDKSLLAMKFNPIYSSRAKDNDWVHSPAKGEYQLRPSWREALG